MKKAFTLAEVLITLAIIGVVAAMTIPTLIGNYKKLVVEVRLAKFYNNMNHALKLSTIDNGALESWDAFVGEYVYNEEGYVVAQTCTNVLDWYNKYLAKYLKTVNVEEAENDVEGRILVYFQDGSMASLTGSTWLFYPYANDYSTTEFYVGSFKNRDKSVSGTKYFVFVFVRDKGLLTFDNGWDGTKEHLLNHPSLGCNEEATNERAYCTKLIQLNNWKIPKDYPFKF